MKNNRYNITVKKYILIALTLRGLGIVNAQNTTIVVSNSVEKPGTEVNIKWISDKVIYDEGVFIYRREEHVPFWTKLNETPIKKGIYQVPLSAYTGDTTLQAYIDMAKDATQADVKEMVKVFFLLKAVYSNEFSRYIGIQYDDNTVTEGKIYRYMIKKIKGNTEIFESVSEPIIVGAFVSGKSPKGVRAEAGNKKVNFWWKPEDKRFHSINVYRSLGADDKPVKVNDQPVVLATRIGPEGKEGYPEIYFTDNTVKNDTTYYYYLTGIDFFGRETEPSEIVLARPINRTPPPAAEYLDCKVNLLNVELAWSLPDNRRVEGIKIYRSHSIYAPFKCITPQAMSTFSVRFSDKVDKPGNYYYYVATIDKNGNENRSNLTMAQVLDIYPPDAPKNLIAESDSARILLNWNSVQDEYFGGYRLYRTIDASREDFYVLLNAQPITDTFFIDKLPFNARNKFYYRVVALDTALNRSDYSNIATAVLPDVTPPDVPFIKNISISNNAFVVEWLPNFDADLLGFDLYREIIVDSVSQIVKVNSQLIALNETSYVDADVKKDVTYNYFLVAMDSVGHRSAESNRFQVVIQSEAKNNAIELKNIEVKYNVSKENVQLKWQYPSGITAKGVVIFRRADGSEQYLPVSGLVKEEEFFDTLPAEGEKFFYRIFSYSQTGEKWNSTEYVVERIKKE
jgi:fibronectin type 3 domain-containing protein